MEEGIEVYGTGRGKLEVMVRGMESWTCKCSVWGTSL